MTSAVTETDSTPAAPRAGADLRAARERLGWPIEAVADALRIRRPHLEALEEGRIDLLPGYAYAVGFLRTYAHTLGLDPDEIVRRFKAEASEVNKRTELVFPAPMPQRGLPAGAVVLLGVVLAIGAYAGWYRLSGEGRLPAETVTPVPQPLVTLAEQAMPPVVPARPAAAPTAAAQQAAASPPGAAGGQQDARLAGAGTGLGQSPAPAGQVDADAQPAAEAAPQKAATAVGPAQAAAVLAAGPAQPPITGSLPGAAGQAVPPPVPAISPTSAAAASVPLAMAPPAAADQTTAPSPDAPHIVLKATADAWIQVRDKTTGTVLLSRVLHSGETWPVPERPNLVLTTGNAGGTELVVDGVAVQVPGGSGAVRRDLTLDPDQIRAGRLAQLTPPAILPAATGAAGNAGQSGLARSPGQ